MPQQDPDGGGGRGRLLRPGHRKHPRAPGVSASTSDCRVAILTLGGYYAKTVNQVYLQDTNIPAPTTNGEPLGLRDLHGSLDAPTARRTAAVTSAIFHNTSAGQTFSGTVQLQKAYFAELSAACTASRTTSQISATSSRAFSSFWFRVDQVQHHRLGQ